MGFSFHLPARDLLYAQSFWWIAHATAVCYNSRGSLTPMKNSVIGLHEEEIPRPIGL